MGGALLAVRLCDKLICIVCRYGYPIYNFKGFTHRFSSTVYCSHVFLGGLARMHAGAVSSPAVKPQHDEQWRCLAADGFCW